MTLTLHQNCGYSFRLIASDAVQALVSELKAYPLTVHVRPTPAGFWMTQDELSGLGGPIGLMGPRGPRGLSATSEVDDRPTLRAKMQLVSIEGKCSNAGKELGYDFIAAKGAKPQDLIPPLTYTAVYDYQEVKYGWYKRPGFDAIRAAMSTLMPDITEKQFASLRIEEDTYGYDFNTDLVEYKLYTTSEGCIEERNKREQSGVNHYTFSLCCLDSDLEANSGAIRVLLQSMDLLE